VSEPANGSTGFIFDVQRFSVHDGPGIRTLVFFKGCPLSCQWCANPECLSGKPQTGFIKSLCASCGKCLEACKTMPFGTPKASIESTIPAANPAAPAGINAITARWFDMAKP
jgi:pyruvate-formate lyase-activating enzyme